MLKIELKKDTYKRTILLRFIFYSILLFCSSIILYAIDVYVPIQSVKHFSSLIILAILVLLFQYLIYAYSLNKHISYGNFKDVFFEQNKTENPIKFIFPEFDFFYDLKESDLDKKNALKLDEIASFSIDEQKSLEIEGKFKNFISDNLVELLEYEVVIRMKRKGKAIFDDLIEDYPKLEKLVPYTDSYVMYYPNKIKKRNVLIFDDSIHHGKSAKDIIEIVQKIGYNKILFLTVISQKDSLESLKTHYSEDENIQFREYIVKDENGYKKFYADYMFGYLDHVNSSLEHDNALIKMKIGSSIDIDTFKNLLSGKRNFVYEVERFVEKENEYKISLECPWLYDKMKKSFFKNIKMDMVKVRFFVKLNPPDEINPSGTTDINLSPTLVPREFKENFCKKSKTKDFCLIKHTINLVNDLNESSINVNDLDDEIKDMLCINCVIGNLTREFVDAFMIYFKRQLIDKNHVNIIEEKIRFPLPNEIYNPELTDPS